MNPERRREQTYVQIQFFKILIVFGCKLWDLFPPLFAHSFNHFSIVSHSFIPQLPHEHQLHARPCSGSWTNTALNKTDQAPSPLRQIHCKANKENSRTFPFRSKSIWNFMLNYIFIYLFIYCFLKKGPQIYMFFRPHKPVSAPTGLMGVIS